MELNNLVVFCYDFPHLKTKLGLQLLDLFGPEKSTIVAAPWKKLNINESNIRTQTNEIEYLHPKEICNKKEWDYFAYNHDSPEIKDLLMEIKPDVGIIFGSRILPIEVIEMFKLGILNLHPGLLPENRGLNTIQNAVLKKIPQAVTLHFINKEVDMGKKIITQFINLAINDNLFDVQKKILNTEMGIIRNLFEGNIDLENIDNLETKTSLNKVIGEDFQESFYTLFEDYKNNYTNILNNYKNKE